MEPKPPERVGMSSEGQTIREALDTLLLLLVDEHRTSDEHEIEIREEYAPAFEALAALEARLAEYENAISWGCSSVAEAHYLDKNYEMYMEIQDLKARLAEVERALQMGVEIAAQFMDTGRGDLDGWLDTARAALSSERERIGREKASDELEDALGLPSESETPTTKGTQ